ncbi:MAG TPA: heavy metal-binding domain-containing protein [Bryobacteraceae bacterium]|nr:heavy metal-binding domain-containing protein [Bryobacteraceae bacterium]
MFIRAFSRRAFIQILAGSASAFALQKPQDTPAAKDWICPMDPDYRSDKPGVCPRCGMTLVLRVPERIEYPLQVSQHPESVNPGDTVTLTFRVLNPWTGQTVTYFELVHEKLMHLFLVSENLEFFAHLHPVLQENGTFILNVRLPYGGMYRMLADYYPAGSVPQLAVNTLFVSGDCDHPKIAPSLAPCPAENLTASLRLDPAEPLAGLETKLFYTLNPASGLQPYLGAWGHMLVVSSDLIDLLHLHPFLVNGGVIQFNIIFPRSGIYRIWTQFQREGVVDTVVFTVPVKSL